MVFYMLSLCLSLFLIFKNLFVSLENVILFLIYVFGSMGKKDFTMGSLGQQKQKVAVQFDVSAFWYGGF